MTDRFRRTADSSSSFPSAFRRKPIAAILIAGLAISSSPLHAAGEKTATELQGELNRANAEILQLKGTSKNLDSPSLGKITSF